MEVVIVFALIDKCSEQFWYFGRLSICWTREKFSLCILFAIANIVVTFISIFQVGPQRKNGVMRTLAT